MSCLCGSGETTENCCGPIIAGAAAAPTALALMRSRYVAFATGQVDYIIASHHPATRDQVKREEVAQWSTQSEWLGFEVLRSEGGGADDDEGVVDFSARYRVGPLTTDHRERALFRREAGRWYFFDGAPIPKERKVDAAVWKPRGKKARRAKPAGR